MGVRAVWSELLGDADVVNCAAASVRRHPHPSLAGSGGPTPGRPIVEATDVLAERYEHAHLSGTRHGDEQVLSCVRQSWSGICGPEPMRPQTWEDWNCRG